MTPNRMSSSCESRAAMVFTVTDIDVSGRLFMSRAVRSSCVLIEVKCSVALFQSLTAPHLMMHVDEHVYVLIYTGRALNVFTFESFLK